MSIPRTLTLLLAVLMTISSPVQAQESPWKDQPFSCFIVPAMSSIKRLPDHIPHDGKLSDQLQVVMARGEYEPASFVIVPTQAVEKLTFKPQPLKTTNGQTLDASAIDIKVVKSWYQGGTAWYSYFSDNNRRELVPELLLNDETLIRVDHETKNNDLRIGGEYVSISYPISEAKTFFNYLTEPVADAPTLQPVKLTPGENKQIWITFHTPGDTQPGLYEGVIDIQADGRAAGQMRVALRVLPFELPSPKTYYNINNDYLVTIYAANMLDLAKRMGVDRQWARQQQLAIYKNMKAHNVVNVRSEQHSHQTGTLDEALADIREEIELMREAGLSLKPLLSTGFVWHSSRAESTDKSLYHKRIEAHVKTLKEAVGHDDIYLTTWDEAGVDRIKQFRELFEHLHNQGVKLWATTAKGRHFNLAGHGIAYANHGGWPERERAAQWHAIGAKVASYASPHTGPENPDTFRRWEGLARYKANYDGSFNYKYYSQLHPLASLRDRQKQNTWNDFSFDVFRSFNMVYPTRNGVIDTLAWEGLREGIDDVRYATLLKQQAAQAIDSGPVKAAHAARKALIWLELTDAGQVDLNTMRQEIIEHILNIQQAMKE